MPDEFDKPLEQGEADEQGENAEVPAVPLIVKPTPDEHNTKQKTQGTKQYIRPAYDWLRPKLLPIRSLLSGSSFWTAVATVVIAVSTIFYTIYAKKQWQEIKSGSNDTHELAVQAKNQADRMKDLRIE